MVANVMSNRVLPNWAYVPWNLAVVAGLVTIAHGRVSRHQLGWVEWRRGWQWGRVLAGLTVLGLVIGAFLPLTADAFRDGRVSGGWGSLLYHPLVRIPLGTVLLEEVAFRSVVPALVAVRWGVARAAAFSSVLFGLWHVLPALGLARSNATVESAFGRSADGRIVSVVAAVLGTVLVGLWFSWLRYRSRSVVSTMLAHLASNSGAYVLAWSIGRVVAVGGSVAVSGLVAHQ